MNARAWYFLPCLALLLTHSTPVAADAAASPWQGEWGAWREDPAHAGRMAWAQGASVSIGRCGPDGSGCGVRFDVENAATRCGMVGDRWLDLLPRDATHAGAFLREFDGHAKDCRLDLSLVGEGAGRRLEAKLIGSECGYFCSNGVAPLGALALRSPTNFPPLDERICFADGRATRALWCTDADLGRTDAALAAVAEEIARLSRADQATDDWIAEREAILAGCEPAADRAACLGRRFADARGAWQRRLASAEEARKQSDATLGAPGDPARAKALIAASEGVYKTRFANGTVTGESYTSEDILEIVGVAEDALYFRTHLEFYNGHVCDLWGKATFRSNGMFVFDEPSSPGDDGACRLELDVAKDEIRLEDLDGKCREMHCGARGSFSGTKFPRTARRTIRYLDRLKASQEFQDAMAARPAAGN